MNTSKHTPAIVIFGIFTLGLLILQSVMIFATDYSQDIFRPDPERYYPLDKIPGQGNELSYLKLYMEHWNVSAAVAFVAFMASAVVLAIALEKRRIASNGPHTASWAIGALPIAVCIVGFSGGLMKGEDYSKPLAEWSMQRYGVTISHVDPITAPTEEDRAIIKTPPGVSSETTFHEITLQNGDTIRPVVLHDGLQGPALRIDKEMSHHKEYGFPMFGSGELPTRTG